MYKTFIKQVASLQIILGLVMLVPAIFANYLTKRMYIPCSFLIAQEIFTALLGSFVLQTFLKKQEEPKEKAFTRHSRHRLGFMIMFFWAIPYFIIAHITH